LSHCFQKRWRKHSFIFFRVWLAALQKNESVFCALEWVGFFSNLFFCAVAIRSYVGCCPCIKKMFVQSDTVSCLQVANKLAGNGFGLCVGGLLEP